MATTTPNYGWDVPTSSDYVKQGAVAIETLGDDIDASLFSITDGKNVGLIPLVNTTFTTQSAIQVDNVFTTAYDNYKVIFRITAISGNDIAIRMRWVDGTTPATAGHYNGGVGISNVGNSVSTYASAATSAILCYASSALPQVTHFTMDVINPKLTNYTNYSFNSYSYNGAITFSYAGAGTTTEATAYEGIQIYPNSGTFSGNIKIYGYRNS